MLQTTKAIYEQVEKLNSSIGRGFMTLTIIIASNLIWRFFFNFPSPIGSIMVYVGLRTLESLCALSNGFWVL